MFEFMIPMLIVFILFALLDKIEMPSFGKCKCKCKNSHNDEIESMREEIEALRWQISNIKPECFMEVVK